MNTTGLKPISSELYVHPDFEELFREEELTSVEAFFNWSASENLTKPGLASYRSRFRMSLGKDGQIFYMKRFDQAPRKTQIAQWLTVRRRCSCAALDLKPLQDLPAEGIASAKIAAFGQEWSGPFEKRSFIMTEELPEAQSLEHSLPAAFNHPETSITRQQKRVFLKKLAQWVRHFHGLGYRHRDLYLCHIFRDRQDRLYLIDLTRVFKPLLFKRRYLIKDLAQLFYSSPSSQISQTDRLRFYRNYVDHKLSPADKGLIRSILAKAQKMAAHDLRHNRPVPYRQGKEASCQG